METVEELEAYFEGITLPEGPIQLTPGVKIIDPKKMVATAFQNIKSNRSSVLLVNARLDDLIKLKAILSKQ